MEMSSLRPQKFPNRKAIRWDVLGLQNPSETSIDEVGRQILSAASSGLSPDSVTRTQKSGVTPQSISKKPVFIQMQKTAFQNQKRTRAEGKMISNDKVRFCHANS